MSHDANVRALERCVGVTIQDVTDSHQRWALYLRAIERRVCADLLLDIVDSEPDINLASSVVLRMIELVSAQDRLLWTSRISDPKGRQYAEQRSRDLTALRADSLADSLSGDSDPSWSEWLQVRLAVSSREAAVLRFLASRGTTKRIRNSASERLRQIAKAP